MPIRTSVILVVLVAGLLGVAISPIVSPRAVHDPVDRRDRAAAVATPRSRALADAARLDRCIERELARQGRSLSGPVDDLCFARRAHLGIVGRIPTSDELRRFLSSPEPERRAALVDALFDSPGHTARMLPFWADLLRAHGAPFTGISGEPFLDRIARFVEEDEPYDVFVRALLTAEGPAHAPGNGATGHLLRDRGSPEDSMANTARVFLGTRIECAQCHDHPHDRWTQRDFFQLTAFFGGIRYLAPQRGCESVGMDSGIAEMSRPECRAHQLVVDVTVPGIQGPGAGCYRLPDDYASDDARPGSWVAARVPFGEAVELPDPREAGEATSGGERLEQQVRSREAFAAWLSAPQNPRFTRVLCNRLWKLVMGEGLFEPVDDLRDDTPLRSEALLDELEALMLRREYDVREFLRVLCHSRHFARPAVASDAVQAEGLNPGPLVQRLSAEQLWDSMLSWVVEDVDRVLGQPRRQRAQQVADRFVEVKGMSAGTLLEQIESGAFMLSDRESYDLMATERRRQRLAEMEARRRALREQRADEIAELEQRRAEARRQGERAEARRLQRELDAILPPWEDVTRLELVRASDLESPAPPGHFLRRFGQSDREQVDGGRREPNLSQVLVLCNGFVEGRVLEAEGASLMRLLAEARTPEEVLDEAHLSMLGRWPGEEERTAWLPALREDPRQARRDLVWVLGNSIEALFQR